MTNPFGSLAEALKADGEPPFATQVSGIDLIRNTALDAALQFHRKTADDDPQAVVATATEFLAFLQGGQ